MKKKVYSREGSITSWMSRSVPSSDSKLLLSIARDQSMLSEVFPRKAGPTQVQNTSRKGCAAMGLRFSGNSQRQFYHHVQSETTGGSSLHFRSPSLHFPLSTARLRRHHSPSTILLPPSGHEDRKSFARALVNHVTLPGWATWQWYSFRVDSALRGTGDQSSQYQSLQSVCSTPIHLHFPWNSCGLENSKAGTFELDWRELGAVGDMAMEMDMDVVIVGGALAGLAVAVGLQERGIRCHVYEKAPKVRPHSGTALSLAANGLRALDGVKPGLAARMINEGAHTTHMRAIGRVDGEPAKEVIIPYQPGLMCMIPWRTAQQTLAEEVPDQSTLHYRHTFVDYKVIEGGVEARFDVAVDGEGGQSSVETKVVRAKLLVGADGLWSQVRKILVGAEGDEPRDLYLNTWNAVIPTESIRPLNLHESNEICFNHFVSKGKWCHFSDAGCGLTLWQVRGPDVSGEIAEAYAADLEAHGPDVRKVRALRQVEGLEDMHHMVEAIQGTHPDMVREARQVDRKPLTSWSNLSKTVLLIGDAAHAMYPGPGEGARTSFEDAHQLCNLLGEVFCSPPVTSLEDAVTRFEKIRIPRVSRIQAYAAESTYWPEYIPEWTQKLSDEEKAQRRKEYLKWVRQYPECMLGDPESTYWKP